MADIRWQELDLHLRKINTPFSGDGMEYVAALVNEVALRHSGNFPDQLILRSKIQQLTPGAVFIFRLILWLLTHSSFRGTQGWPASLFLLADSVGEWAKAAAPQLFLKDPERREELIRKVLTAFRHGIEGESEATGRERLESLDSVARARILAETQAAQKRAQQIREALARKEAEEAASKYYRE